jgi:hypothetical protein
MAEAALFIGWGAVVRGREAKSLKVFGESAEFFGQLQQDGTIEGLDTVLLSPHGGDLYGFFLLRGTTAGVDELRGREDFLRLIARRPHHRRPRSSLEQSGAQAQTLRRARATLGSSSSTRTPPVKTSGSRKARISLSCVRWRSDWVS